MKFGKEFTAQMVPEWQEAYMDYNSLKTIIKSVHDSRKRLVSTAALAVEDSQAALSRKVSLYRAFSGLTNRHNSSRYKGSPKKKKEEEVILVNSQQAEEGSEGEGYYQTLFLMSPDEGGEQELLFFRKLDNEFNKVVKFYRNKVMEVVKEAEDLNKQMDAFIALRIKVEKPEVQLGRVSSGVIPSSQLSDSYPINSMKRTLKLLIAFAAEVELLRLVLFEVVVKAYEFACEFV